MTIAGVPIILLLGITLFLLLIFQLMSGLRIIKASFATHKKVGMLVVILAMVHGLLAITSNM
ncbi:MAG TPA: hypothetical protein ENN98_07510 [Desulfurivibrio alkaliphilus]|uniref:Uncharacterized protein n=1 Tax=Desulfurivibrio alkaliphilus TaxID=427923 RepID=A0A7C2XAV8_9BACT|nr:hypothetical protein [Desulfurivibrio alkaliphilus]